MKQRLLWADNLKALAIIYVFLVHAGGRVDKTLFNTGWFVMMPIFFFISGYFAKPVGIKNGFIKILKTLLLPAFIFGIVCNFVLHPEVIKLLLNSEFASVLQRLQDVIVTLGGYWFLTSLILVELIYYMLSSCHIAIMKVVQPILMVWALIFPLFFANRAMPLSMNAMISGLAFFYVGNYYKKFENKLSLSKALSLVLFLTYIAASIIISAAYDAWLDVHLNIYNPVYATWMISLIGTFVCVSFFKNYPFDCDVLNYIGSNTLVLYMTNGLVNQGIFFFFKTDMNGTLYGLLVSCIGLLICCGISYIVNKKLPCILGK